MEKYVTQKAQKIVSALYLVTNFIKDNESLKWDIREEGILFVSHALAVNRTVPVEKDEAYAAFISSSEKLLSYLNISLISGVISKMNASIVIDEIESLMSFIKDQYASEAHPPGYILSDSFFATDTPALTEVAPMSDKKPLKNKVSDIKDKKNGRQETILSLLKKDSGLTIKDFVKVIKDCSEKTIQRELIALVEKGVIKREGERRWSTYSLVDQVS